MTALVCAADTACYHENKDSTFSMGMLVDDCWSDDISEKFVFSEECCSNKSVRAGLQGSLDEDLFDLDFDNEVGFLNDVERMLPVSLSLAIRSPLRSVRPEGKR
jgi:hypothetical protein